MLATELPARIGGCAGIVTTPELPEISGSDIAWVRLRPPSSLSTRTLELYARYGDPSREADWGGPWQWPTLHSKFAALGLRFPSILDASAAAFTKETAERIRVDLPEWTNRLIAAVEVISRQLVNPVRRTHLAAHDPFLCAPLIEGRGSLLDASTVTSTAYMNDEETLLTPPLWARAVEVANSKQAPLLEHILLRDARHALRNQEYRRCVVDAATALEVSLSTRLVRELERSLGMKAAATVLKRSQTLGSKCALGVSMDLPMGPQDLQQDLVEPRNKAVHEGADIVQPNALKALRAATAAIDALSTERFAT